ncbi:MAG: TetR/AcrR family transcriptional regulator [Candidatus Acidiferrales bacterium]
MLDALEAVLDKYGLEGATLPRIAAEAGLSPASVYRRFRDKDALMRAVFSRGSEVRNEENTKKVNPEEVGKIGIRDFARNWVAAMIRGYRTRTGLMRATMMYARQHPRAGFVRRQRELEIQGFRQMVQTFLIWREEIRHPDPEQAVGYAMLIVAFVLRELILLDQFETFRDLARLSDDRLREELPRVFLRYLGVKTK